MIEPILILTCTILFILVSAYIDAEHLEEGHWIDNHASRLVQRFIFILTMSIFTIKGAIASGILIAALFDQALNILRGFPFWYLGSTAKWDIYFNKRRYQYILTKVILLIAGIALLFL